MTASFVPFEQIVETLGRGMEQTVVGVDLSRYVPRVALAWASEDPEARWRTLHGSLVFADVSGFTALSERLARRGQIGAEELTEVLGHCFAGLLAVAYAEGGTLLKFGGDALLLLFDGHGHELRATRAALGMRTTIRTLGRLKTSVGNVRLRMSQGVHSGRIELYRVGGSHRELMITGPAASEVVRMESAADAGEVLVSPATADALRSVAPEVLGEPKGPGLLLRPRTQVHLVDGFPEPVTDAAAAAAGVPVAVRNHLLAGGGEPEHRNVAIAFIHFDGTDRLSVEEGPRAVAGALDDLVKLVQRATAEEDVAFLATDIDRDGGKIILAAGAPDAREDDDGRLLRACRRIVDGCPPLAVRIGVNRGHVFAGSVGPPYRQTYTVMGDAVNLAARLMAKASPGEIVVAPSVVERSRSSFATSPLDPFLVKGKSAPVHASLLGERASDDVTSWTAHVVPLVGRDDELALLADAVARRPQVVRIVGDTGLGKSRLLEELRSLAATDVPVRVVTCEQYETATPYFAMRVLVRHVLGVRAAGADGAAHAAAVLHTIDESLAEVAPLLGDVLGLPIADTPATAALQPQYRRTRTAQAVGALLATAFAGGAVLAFDDVQWMDDASLDVLAHLVDTADDRSLSIVCATRNPEVPGGDAITIDLRPLEEGAASDLVERLAGDEPLPAHRASALVARAEGVPLFLSELVRVAVTDPDGELPDSLEAVAAAQIDKLAPRDRLLLRHAAVLGDSFEPPLFAQVVADPSLSTAPAVLRRLGGHLLATPDGRVQFRHRLLRDVAYRGLPFRQRQDLHGRAAHVIERQAGDDALDRAETLSLHCFHAQQFEKCWRYASAAAQRAFDKYALVEACELYTRAIEAARRIPELPEADLLASWKSLAIARQVTGQLREARIAFDKARALVGSDHVTAADLCLRQAEIAYRSGKVTAAMRWVGRGIRAVEHDDAVESVAKRAALLAIGSSVRLATGRTKEAMRLALQAHDAAQKAYATDPENVAAKGSLARASFVVVNAGATLGVDIDEYASTALKLYSELESSENVAALEVTLGSVAFWQGRWGEALSRYERGTATFEAIGDFVDAAVGHANIAEVFADQGRLDDAESIVHRAINAWRAARVPAGEVLARRYLGRISLRRGEAAAALDWFEGCRGDLEAIGMAPKVLEVDVWIAECHLALGRVDDAVALLDDCLAREVESGSLELRAMIHRLRAYAALAQGRLEDAWASVDESLAVARGRGSSYDVALALEAFAVLAERGARPVDAQVLVERDALLSSLGVERAPRPPIALGV
ncbi:MAG TPA: adenylate/guanylate cyclase domain-containing protein [Acidimicrobiales bacterium]|nr:adenylate/guanylate cyclase domain-containing protein [Acidimicrobiales bacterium]